MENRTAKQMLLNTATEILAGLDGAHLMSEQAMQLLLTDTLQQIRYSVERMAQDLETIMGFSPDYAWLTASQIAPKPVLYSLMILQATQSSSSKVSHEERYQILAPEFTSFLFDQNIDSYNGGYHEPNAVQQMIEKAATRLPYDPDFYRHSIDQVLDLCWNGVTYAGDLPGELRGLGLLVPYVHWHKQRNVSRSEIADVLYTVADVLTNEHLAQLAFGGGAYPIASFRRYNDFVDSALGEANHLSEEPAENTVARALLRGQGFLMVSASHYLLRTSEASRTLTASKPRSLRTLLHTYPELVELVRLAEALVRTGDDLGDLPIDLDTHSPNIFLGNSTLRQTFLRLALISTNSSEMDDLLTRGRQQSKIGAHAVALLSEMEKIFYDTILAQGNPYGYPNDVRTVVGIIRAVVYGSKINARYNDRIAASIGHYAGGITVSETLH